MGIDVNQLFPAAFGAQSIAPVTASLFSAACDMADVSSPEADVSDDAQNVVPSRTSEVPSPDGEENNRG